MSKYIGIIGFSFLLWNSTAFALLRCNDGFRESVRILSEAEVYHRFEQIEATLNDQVLQVNQKFGDNAEINKQLSDLLIKISGQEAKLAHLTERFLLDELLTSKDFKGVEKSLADIDQLIQNIDEAFSPNSPKVQKQRKGPPDINQIDGFDQMRANEEHSIPGHSGISYRVSFTKKALSDIMNKRLHPDYRKQFFKALQKGVQPGTNESGVKIMKTHEGLFFAEIKLIGRKGDKRIFGLIQDNHISFRFMGTDSESAADINHKRLKALKW